MNSADSVSVTTVIAVDPFSAFSIFTEEIALWWKPKVRSLFRNHGAGVMKFEQVPSRRLVEVDAENPDDSFEVGRVLSWVPGKCLVFEWRQGNFGPGDVTEVEVRFEAVEKGTRVTIEHRGWSSLPPDHPARHGYSGEAFTTMIGLGWADLSSALNAHTAQRGRAL